MTTGAAIILAIGFVLAAVVLALSRLLVMVDKKETQEATFDWFEKRMPDILTRYAEIVTTMFNEFD